MAGGSGSTISMNFADRNLIASLFAFTVYFQCTVEPEQGVIDILYIIGALLNKSDFG